MSGDAASSPRPPFTLPSDTRQPHDFWVAVVGSVDALLRAYYGIFEFSEDPGCLLRIALIPARAAIVLADGTHVEAGDPIGALHWWNEHLLRYSANGPDLGWARDMQRRVRHSLALLSDYVERDAACQRVAAFRGDATFSSRLGARQIRRVAQRYGFELVEPPASRLHRLEALGGSLSTWALTRAFNPSALPRQPFLRTRRELWISRAMLLSKYGGRRRPERAA